LNPTGIFAGTPTRVFKMLFHLHRQEAPQEKGLFSGRRGALMRAKAE